ncbi:PREDICTED: uncharacterized protein LOC108381845, partial [Rhagoletis zephyria]|uniref:uncharacterized protein LOC108381845 n=1 Tax=Rhagoletis zephyria TaxID=28612 RepID=UPI00081192D9
MQVFSNASLLLNLIGLSLVNQKCIQTLTDIVAATSLERQVNTILYTSYENISTFESNDELKSSHLIRALAIGLPQPLLHFDYSAPVEPYRKQFNTELLTIARLGQQFDPAQKLLTTLWQRLWHNTQSRLILLFADSAKATYVTGILKMCARNRAMNVIALQPRMAVEERKFWTLRIFPTTKVLKSTFPENYKDIFPKHLENMYGRPIRTFATEPYYPEFYNYTIKDGSTILSGYYGRALTEYAYLLNSTIEQKPPSVDLIFADPIESVRRNTYIDIGQLAPIHSVEYNISVTDVFSYLDCCLMVPLEAPFPKSTFYYKIMHKSFVFLFGISVALISIVWRCTARSQSQQRQEEQIFEYFFNFSVLQGLLGMPFWTNRNISVLHKNICVFIWFTGILIGTTYNAFLQSYSVDAPIGAQVKTIDDILNRGVKVAVYTFEKTLMESMPEYSKYLKNLTEFSNLTEYQLLRNTFDIRYAFMVYKMWGIYDEQQKYFSRPLFRLTDICLFKNLPMVFPLQENSEHEERLNDFRVRLQEAGLIEFWLRHRIYVEMLEMDLIHIEDWNKKPPFEPMTLEDLHIVLA